LLYDTLTVINEVNDTLLKSYNNLKILSNIKKFEGQVVYYFIIIIFYILVSLLTYRL